MKERNNVTEIVFILDKSGSMSGFEKDTIGGFNSTIEKQKKEDGKVYVSTVLFSNESEAIHDRVDIEKIGKMTEEDYVVGGCTALYDAIGDAIHHIGNIHKYARPEDVPEHTVFIITTDGMENASHRYSSKKVKEMIKERTKKDGWEFIFMAANIDAEDTAEKMGISPQMAVNFVQDEEGIGASYDAMSMAITGVRKNRSLQSCGWRDELDKRNVKKRK
ncbi:MAG: VWA domain-containing protein [Clostridia bacterium]|nr:VWA domain-containing protein [Clostridia bacterium]